jgi:hypothetical protein
VLREVIRRETSDRRRLSLCRIGHRRVSKREPSLRRGLRNLGWTRRAAAPRVTETVEATSGKKIASRIWYSQEGHRLFKTGAYSSLPDISKFIECSTHHRPLEFGRSSTSPLDSSPACSEGDRTATHKAIFVSSELITPKRAMMGPQIDEKPSSIQTLISSMCMCLFAWAATISTGTEVFRC